MLEYISENREQNKMNVSSGIDEFALHFDV